MRTLFFALSALLFAVTSAHAIDPGVAEGWLQIDGGEVRRLTHAYAFREHPQEMRILIADRAVPENILPHITQAAVSKMALDGQLGGLLIRLDPARPKNAAITPLGVLKGGRGNVRSLSIAYERVLGDIQSYPTDIFEFAFAATFSAPLFADYGTVPGGSVTQ